MNWELVLAAAPLALGLVVFILAHVYRDGPR